MTKPKKAQHGGKREGAGRKLKFGGPTTTIRVPKFLKDWIFEQIKLKLAE